MNAPPNEFIRVPHEAMRRFVDAVAQAAGAPAERAHLLAELLTTNDLRGVFSHGTQQIAAYARLMREGSLNPTPDIRVVRETPTSLQLDGDGGLGYFPSHEGTLRIIEKAKEHGIAVLSTGNHGHFGAAGIYARMPLEHDLLTYVTSGHQMGLSDGGPYVTAAGGSPMAFGAPAGDGRNVVVDFGAIHDCYAGDPHRIEISRLAPGTVFRGVGLGAICQSWGGFLAGVPYGRAPEAREWPGANQGSFVITLRISLFAEPADFYAELQAYMADVAKLEPLDGFDEAMLPGSIEARREAAYREEGIPVGERHRKGLTAVGTEFGITPPW
ncbi:hypothetical protein CMK11_16085 [Candidatus Poribacteria bacterium]|nr:hypothetical protein [Candidatus Poribacteria bacterium]